MDEALSQTSELYREHILDHYKNPRNFGILKSADIRQREFNPLCGDDLEFNIKLDGNKIEDVRFKGRGCAISQASASMLTEFVKNKKINEVNELTREDIIEMLGIPIGPVRIKCAVLSLVALKNGIKEFGGLK